MTPMLRRDANEAFRHMLTRTIALPLVLLILLAAIFFGLITNLLSATQWVDHSNQVIAEAYEARAALADQEAGLRGYLLAGEQSFLEPYTAASAVVEQKFDALEALVADNPAQIERIAAMRAENREWQAFAQQALALHDGGGDYLSLLRTGEGRRRMDTMRALSATFIANEDTLRTSRSAAAQRSTQLVLYGSILSALLLGGVLAYATRRALTRLSQTYNTALRSAEANEQELYTQREWFRSTLTSIGDAVIATDARGSISFMNAVAEGLTGWTSDQALGRPIDDVFVVVNEHTRERAEVPVGRVLREGVVVGLANHTAIVRRDGTSVQIDDSAAPVRDPGGSLIGAVLVFRDISERYKVESTMRESERRYRNLAEAMPMIVWTTTPTGTIDYYNRRFQEYTGMTLEEAQNPELPAIIAPEDSEALARAWQKALTTGESMEVEYRIRRRDGAYRWFLSHAHAVRDEQGQVIQWIGTSTDIHDRKIAEEALLASEMQFRHLADAMPQLVWITRPDGYHEYFNQRWYTFTGTTLEQTRGEGWSALLHPDDFERTQQVWRHSLATGNPYEIEYRFKEAATGEYRWFLARAMPVHDEKGTITQWFGTCTDIEAQKQAEVALRERGEELLRATTALEERNRELDQFAYVTSHDLKAPLRGIANLSQWIEEDLGEHATEDIRRQLELLRGRVHRMEGLIDGILQYSRIGRVKSAIEQVDLNQLLAETIDLLAPPPTVTITVDPDLPTLQAERLRLQQVFQNLIGNAIKYGQRPDLTIEVRCKDVGKFYEFSVSDNGPGIAPQYHEKVFVIFQTLASRDKVEGTGLGLSLVKKIVERQGGRVWVESEEGAGATFRFQWPKRPPSVVSLHDHDAYTQE